MSDLLPPNATAQERALAGATARVSDVPVAIRDVWRPDDCPEALLPWLAWALSVDAWNNAWSAAQKRAAIQASFAVHRAKGTLGAVRRAVEALGYQLAVVEWFQESPPGAPYTFRVEITAPDGGLTLAEIERVEAVINQAKNVRSHMAGVRTVADSPGTAYWPAFSVSGLVLAVEPH